MGRAGGGRGAVVTVERVVDDLRPWSHLVRIPAHRVLAVCEAAMARTRAACSPVTCRSTGTARTTSSGSSSAASRGDDFDVDPPLGARRRRPARVPLRLGDDRIASLRAKADPDSWRTDGPRTSPTWTRRPTGGSWPPSPVPGTSPTGWARSTPTVLAAPRRQPVGMARRRAGPVRRLRRAAHGRDRAVGLRAHAGRPVRPQPPQLPALHDAGRRRARPGHARAAGRGRRPWRASAVRRSTASATSTRRSSPTARFSWARVAATTSPASPPRRSWWRPSRPAARRPSAATSPHRGGRCAPRDGSRHAREGRRRRARSDGRAGR